MVAEEDPLATDTPTFEAERQPHTHSPFEFDWFDQYIGELNSPLAGDSLPPTLATGPYEGPECSISGFQLCGSSGLEGPLGSAAHLPGAWDPLPHVDEVIARAEAEALPQSHEAVISNGKDEDNMPVDDLYAWLWES